MTEELQCECCSLPRDDLNLHHCMICGHLFCDQCLGDHPCVGPQLEG